MSMPKKLKILWGSEQPTRPTGYGTVTRELAKRLVAMGHEVYVMGWDYNGEPFKHEEGWTMIHSGISGFGSEKMAGAGSPTILDYHLQTLKPDVYISLIDAWYIGHAVVSTNKANVPYVAYLPIDGFPISYAWKDIIKMLHTPLWMANYGKEVFADFISEYSSVGSANKDLLDPVLDRYIENTGDVLYHGVDNEVFIPLDEDVKLQTKKDFGIDHFDFVFLCVARNTNRKQHPRLLEAFSNLLKQVPNPEKIALLLHCGDANDTMGMGGWNLPVLAKQMGLENNVRFTDKGDNPLFGLSREELALVYGVADVHVMATGGEGFGIPTIEGMACGLPTILPDNSTGTELVGVENNKSDSPFEKGQRGWLVRNATTITGPKWGVKMGLVDIDALTMAMKDSIDDDIFRLDAGESARNWVVETCDWDWLAKQTESILLNASQSEHPLGKFSTLGM